MKEITRQDIDNLLQKFDRYKETAEQYEFINLLMIDVMIEKTNLDEIVNNQKEARSMFRCILKTMHEDFSSYEEENHI